MSTPTPPTPIEKLSATLQLHATLIGNLNNLLGFYLVIAGFLFAGYFQLTTADTPRCLLTTAVAVLGVVMSTVFLLLDFRARAITDQVEGTLYALEDDIYVQPNRPYADAPPPPKLLGLYLGHRFLIRSVYVLLGVSFLALAGIACVSRPPPAEPKPAEPASISVEISSTTVKRCCAKSPSQPARKPGEGR